MTLDPFKAIEITLGINPKAAKIAAGGFIVLALAIAARQMLGDTTVTFWQMLAALAALMLAMLVLSHLPIIVGRLCGWVIGLCFCLWASALTSQVIANDTLPIAPVKCIASFGLAENCGNSYAAAGADVEPERVVTAGASTPEPAPPSAPDGQAEARVFVQFAGFPRGEIVALAETLTAQGWPVEGSADGGERTGAAAGLNEVRFLNPEDKALAEALALAVSAGLQGNPAIAVKDLSGTKYRKNRRGTLEVWISE